MPNDNQEPKPDSSKNSIGSLFNFNNYASTLIKQLTPLSEIYIDLGRSLTPIINMQEELSKSIKPLADIQQQITTQNQLIAQGFAKSVQNMLKPLENFRLNLDNLISPAFVEFARILAALPERTRTSLMVLAKHGWYFDPQMSFRWIQEIESTLDDGDIETVNAVLMEYFSERLSEIEENLKTRFPARAIILESAFNAHKRKEYALSIPVFLIQADGICYDLINKQLYSKKGKVPVVAEYAETITADVFRSALLYPLTQPLPISASANERTEDFSDLNRHQVIHGESTTYDTEINSLKAISMLNYISYVLNQDSADSDEKVIG